MEASNNNGNVTVDLSVQVPLRDGDFFNLPEDDVCRLRKDVLLSASVYQRGLTDSTYRDSVINGLVRQHVERKSWRCGRPGTAFIVKVGLQVARISVHTGGLTQ